MLHAKTAVADGRWTRMGSTNLNLESWLGNWELDVAIEDPAFAARMEDMYLDDLGRATEIALTARARVVRTAKRAQAPAGGRAARGGRRRGRSASGAR